MADQPTALPESRVEEIRATDELDLGAGEMWLSVAQQENRDLVGSLQILERFTGTADGKRHHAQKVRRQFARLMADRDRLQRRVEELEEQAQRVATVAQAFGEGRRHMDGLERCGEIARAALTSETPHAK